MGYTNKDYINTFTKYHKCVDLNPESNDKQLDISPLLPFILADTGYKLYEIRTAIAVEIRIEAMP